MINGYLNYLFIIFSGLSMPKSNNKCATQDPRAQDDKPEINSFIKKIAK